ncbi:hypothetical protein M0805_009236 [Coniferiporia weirii]|nr:hypothetical protein M0805_009236 [Coniferiporia weirii]
MHYLLHVLALFFVSAASGVIAQNGPSSWTATPFNPPALPLAVRSPYLSSWVAQGNSPLPITNTRPGSWFVNQLTSWSALVLVDGEVYRILGDVYTANITQANQTAVEFTPTSTTFVLTAGQVQINATFLNPIEPADLVRQSLPFSYFYMSAASLDGNPHNLRMYSDVTGDFIAGSGSEIIQWTPDDNEDDYVILKMQLQTQQAFTEVNNFPQDGTEYYTLKKINGTTTSWSITGYETNRGIAANASLTLNNTTDTPPAVVGMINRPVLSIMVDWGSITDTPEPAVWALGVVRDPSVQYLLAGGMTQMRSPYFMSAFNDTDSAAQFFLDDFTRAQSAAVKFDEQLRTAGAALSNDYADLLALSVLQVMGALDITLASNVGGAWDFSDVKVFMKNMGSAGSDSDGGTMRQGVNTVDVLYAAFPAMLYLNPELGGYLLAPLLEYQDSAAYTQTYAARNIGSAYPNATADGIDDAHNYQVEETSNMLIMTLAYSQASGNGTFLTKHYTLLRSWADFLVNNTLNPVNQKSADFEIMNNLSDNNQTNTALKGIIGIAAMARIAEIVDEWIFYSPLQSTATSYIEQWTSDAVAADSTHVDFFYNNENSNGLIYNLYADKLLGLELVSDEVYQVLTNFYGNIASQTNYGLPLSNQDSSIATASSIMFAASTLTNTKTREFMVGQLHGYVSASLNSTPFTVVFDPTSGQAINGQGAGVNSPTVGSLFSLLALNVTNKPISLPTDGSTVPGASSSHMTHKSGAAAIGGGIGGGLVILGAFGLSMSFCMRRRRETLRRQGEYDAHTSVTIEHDAGGSSRQFAFNTSIEPFLLGTETSATSDYSSSAFTSYSPKSRSEGVSMRSTSPSDVGPISLVAQVGYASRSGDRLPPVHRRGETPASSTDEGGVNGVSRGSGERLTRGEIPLQQVIPARRPLPDEGLRSEVENLRRDVERLQRERVVLEEAPPLYTDTA